MYVSILIAVNQIKMEVYCLDIHEFFCISGYKLTHINQITPLSKRLNFFSNFPIVLTGFMVHTCCLYKITLKRS